MQTLLHLIKAWSDENPQAPAQYWKNKGTWNCFSISDIQKRVTKIANYLISVGMETGDIGLIFAPNSPQWVQLDIALMLAGGSSSGIYTNASNAHMDKVLEKSKASILVVGDAAMYKKIFNKSDPTLKLPHLKKIIVLKGKSDFSPLAISVDQMLSLKVSGPQKSFSQLLQAIDPEQTAILIFTSGTTGNPKGVMLSHKNLAFAAKRYTMNWQPPKEGSLYSFLPLAHIAERIYNLGNGLSYRYPVYFCSGPTQILAELSEVQPSILLCVPRFWDKLKQGVENKIKRGSPKQQKIAAWAFKVGNSFQTQWIQNRHPSLIISAQHKLAEKLVLRKIRESLGMSRIVRAVSGAAALAPETLQWYRSLGVNIIEAYALSETSGILTCGIQGKETAHTVGVPYPDIEYKLRDDGEILTRGEHVFKGYYNDQEATDAMFCGGWLKTGDIGEITESGYLKIQGRKREIIKNAEGKMISPLPIEANLEANHLVDQAIVIGNEKPYLTALLTLNPDSIKNIKVEKDSQNVTIETQALTEKINAHLMELNRAAANHERIKNFRILANPFSIESGEVTSTMKLRRQAIEKKYDSIIESMY